jgi:hypothetical protein
MLISASHIARSIGSDTSDPWHQPAARSIGWFDLVQPVPLPEWPSDSASPAVPSPIRWTRP